MVESKRRKRSARFIEIAQEAGVSIATVDRVMNERDSVSEKTRLRVIEAARLLGVPRLLPDAGHALVHFDVLLPLNATPFFLRLNRALSRSTEMLDRRVVVHRRTIEERKISAIVDAIARPPYKRQGLIIAAPDTPRIRDCLAERIAAGETVVAIVTDIEAVAGLHYVGIDHVSAGRTAGHILGRFIHGAGRIVLMSGRSDYRGHSERRAGCIEVLRRDFPEKSVQIGDIETNDAEERCYRAVAAALASGEPLAGIYNTGAGSRGIERALRVLGGQRKICWVTHEISDDHRAYLEAGILDMVIDQNPDRQAMSAIQRLLYGCGIMEQAPDETPGEFSLYFAHNVARQTYLP